MTTLKKNFLALTVMGVMTSMAGIIDSSFANHLGLDEICVASACGAIESVCYALVSIGSQTNRTTNRNRRMCCLVQLVVSLLISVLTFFGSERIASLFAFSTAQQKLLIICIKSMAIMFPFRGVNWFYDYHIQLKGYHKLYSISSVVWMIALIATDILALHLGWGLPGMLVMSGVSSFLQVLVFVGGLILSGHFFEPEVAGVMNRSAFLEVFQIGLPRVIMNFFARGTRSIANMALSVLPSRQYAIIGVCSSVMLYIKTTSTDACYKNIVRKLFQTSRRMFQRDLAYALRMFRELLGTSFFANMTLGIFFLFLCHGKLSFLECFPYLLLMLLALLAISVSETVYAVINIHLWDTVLLTSSILGFLGAVAGTWFLVYLGHGYIAGIWGNILGLELIRLTCYGIAIHRHKKIEMITTNQKGVIS